jgi:hypothetical protein
VLLLPDQHALGDSPGESVLQSQLSDELAELQARLHGWGEIGLGSDACLISWSEFYKNLLTEASFQEACLYSKRYVHSGCDAQW